MLYLNGIVIAFVLYGNQLPAIAGILPAPNLPRKNILFVKKLVTEGSAKRFWKCKPSIPGSFVRDIGVLEIDFQKMVILRRRNGHPETEGIKNEHLASTKRSFVIYTLAHRPGCHP